MEFAALHAVLQQQPFRPFRIATTDGAAHVVGRREDAVLSATAIAVGHDIDRSGLACGLQVLALTRIARVEWLDVAERPADDPPAGIYLLEPTMNPKILQARLRAVPFRPFRVFVSDGSGHDVRHPELMYVTEHWISIADTANRHGIPRDTVFLNPLHVTRIELLPDGDSGSKQAS